MDQDEVYAVYSYSDGRRYFEECRWGEEWNGFWMMMVAFILEIEKTGS